MASRDQPLTGHSGFKLLDEFDIIWSMDLPEESTHGVRKFEVRSRSFHFCSDPRKPRYLFYFRRIVDSASNTDKIVVGQSDQSCPILAVVKIRFNDEGELSSTVALPYTGEAVLVEAVPTQFNSRSVTVTFDIKTFGPTQT